MTLYINFFERKAGILQPFIKGKQETEIFTTTHSTAKEAKDSIDFHLQDDHTCVYKRTGEYSANNTTYYHHYQLLLERTH